MTNVEQESESDESAVSPGVKTLAVLIVGVVAPIILAGLLWLTPNATVRTSDAGAFVSASTSAGGFSTPAMTSVQTDIGTIAVTGAFSALHGQRLQVQDGLKSGLRLCVVDANDVCADMAGQWTGHLTAVPYRHTATDWIGDVFGAGTIAFAFLGGMAALMIAFFTLTPADVQNHPEDEEPEDSPPDSSTAP